MQKFDAKFMGFLVICLILALWLGFILGRVTGTNSRQVANVISQDKNVGLFDSQTANIWGKVKQINGRNLLIENADGKKGAFELSENVNVSQTENGQRVATTSGDAKFIKINERALIVFTEEAGVFKVTSISYLPATSELPAPTKKGTPVPNKQ